jgi:hypothetical protein
MTEVLWNEKTLLMFTEDIESRGEVLNEELSWLNLELTAAREAYQRAKVAHELIADADCLNSDSQGTLRHANVALNSAWDRYQVALLAFASYRSKHGAER